MEIRISSKTVLLILNIICFLIFVGICIDACGYLSNTIYSLFIKPDLASEYWTKIDFSKLYAFDKGHFAVQTLFMIIASVLQAIMFYVIIRLLNSKKFDLSKPFNDAVRNCISIIAYLSFGIGLFSNAGIDYANWLSSQGVSMPDIQKLQLEGGDVWLFMGVILLVIAQIFKRGIEMQSEQELTI